jgi:AbrB family looped-hinge helix DNA binding protein
MSTKGQVVIPAEVRKALALDRNSEFEVETHEGAILLRPVKKSDWRKLFGALPGKSLTELLEEEHREERESGK